MIVHDIMKGLAAKLSHISNITNTPYPVLVNLYTYIVEAKKATTKTWCSVFFFSICACFVLVHVAPFRHIIYNISCFSIFFSSTSYVWGLQNHAT